MSAVRAAYTRLKGVKGEKGDLVSDLNAALGEIAMGEARAYLLGHMSLEEDLGSREDEGFFDSADTEGALALLREQIQAQGKALAADPARLKSLRRAAFNVAPTDADYLSAVFRLLGTVEGVGHDADAPINQSRLLAAALRVEQASKSAWFGTPSADLAYAALVDLSAPERAALWSDYSALFKAFAPEDQAKLKRLCTDPEVTQAELVREGLRAAAASGDAAVQLETAQATGAWSKELQAQASQGSAQAVAWGDMQIAVDAQAFGDEATHDALAQAGALGALGMELHQEQSGAREVQLLAATDEDSLVDALDAIPQKERRAAHTDAVRQHISRLGLDSAPRVYTRWDGSGLHAEVTADVRAFAQRGELGRLPDVLARLGGPDARFAWSASAAGQSLMRDPSVSTVIITALWSAGDDAADAMLDVAERDGDRSLALAGLDRLSADSRALLRAATLSRADADADTRARLDQLERAGLDPLEPDVAARLTAGVGLDAAPTADGKERDLRPDADYLAATVARFAGLRDAESLHVTDAVGRTSEHLFQEVLEFAVLFRELTAGDGIVSQDEYLILKAYADNAIQAGSAYKEARSGLASAASAIAATAAAALIIAASGGTATPAVIAAAIACGGVTAARVDYAIRGEVDAELAMNVATGMVEAGLTAIGVALSARVLASAGAGAEATAAVSGVKQLAPTASTEALASILDGAVGGAGSQLFVTIADQRTWDQGVEHALGLMLLAILQGAAAGAAGSTAGEVLSRGVSAGAQRALGRHGDELVDEGVDAAEHLDDAAPIAARADDAAEHIDDAEHVAAPVDELQADPAFNDAYEVYTRDNKVEELNNQLDSRLLEHLAGDLAPASVKELRAVLPKEVLETLAKDLSGPEIKALVDGMGARPVEVLCPKLGGRGLQELEKMDFFHFATMQPRIDAGEGAAARGLPPLRGKPMAEVKRTLSEAGFTLYDIKGGTERWTHPDHSIARVKFAAPAIPDKYGRMESIVLEISKIAGNPDAGKSFAKIAENGAVIPAGPNFAEDQLMQWFKKTTRSAPDAGELAALNDVWGEAGHITITP